MEKYELLAILEGPRGPQEYFEDKEPQKKWRREFGDCQRARGPLLCAVYTEGCMAQAGHVTSLCLSILICKWGSRKLSCPTYLTGLL